MRPDPDRELLLRAHRVLLDASASSDAFPVVPASAVRVYRALAISGATEREPIDAHRLFAAAECRAQPNVGPLVSLLAALLAHYAPALAVRRRRIRGVLYGYWLETSGPGPALLPSAPPAPARPSAA